VAIISLPFSNKQFKVSFGSRQAPDDLRVIDRGPEGPQAQHARRSDTEDGMISGTKWGEKAEVREHGLLEYLMGEYGIEYKPEGELEIEDYQEMLDEDAEVFSAMQYKILARLSSGWEIEPASDEREHQQHAEFIRAQLQQMRGTVSEFLENAMDALSFGASVNERIYRPITEGEWRGKVGLQAIKPRPIKTFRFITDKHGNLERLEQRQGITNTFTTLDHNYFVIWVWRGKGSYVGRSELRAAYRWFKAKQILPQLWFLFLERYAAPSAVGKFEPNTDPSDKAEVLGFLEGLKGKGAAIVPKDWELELIESARRGVDYQDGLKYCDAQIRKAVLLPSLISSEGERGAYSLGQRHADNFTWVLDALGERLAEDVMGDQVIRPLIDLNFRTDRYPEFRWREYAEETMQERVDAVAKMVDCRVLDPDDQSDFDVARQRLDLPERQLPPPPKPTRLPAPPPPVADPDPNSDPPAPPADGKQGDPVAATHHRQADHAAGADGARQLKHAAKHKHVEIAAAHDREEAESIAEITEIIDGMRRGLNETIRKRKLAETRDQSEIGKLRMVGVGELRAALERLTGHALHRGAADAFSEVRRGIKAVGTPVPEIENLGDTMNTNYTVAPPSPDHPYAVPISRALFDHGVIEAAGANHAYTSTRRDIIDYWKGKVPIQRQLLAQYSRQSFTITGAFSDELLGRVQVTLGKGMIRGATLAQMQLAVNDIFMPYLADPGALDPALANPWRVENIVRTNLAEAYSTGRMNMMQHPEVGTFIVAYEYSSIMDDRTTEFCRDWNGTVMRADDPRVMANNPPNHYQCRSIWIPIVRGEQYLLTAIPATEPMTGFKI